MAVAIRMVCKRGGLPTRTSAPLLEITATPGKPDINFVLARVATRDCVCGVCAHRPKDGYDQMNEQTNVVPLRPPRPRQSPRVALTSKRIADLRPAPDGKRARIADSTVPGLWVNCAPGGN